MKLDTEVNIMLAMEVARARCMKPWPNGCKR